MSVQSMSNYLTGLNRELSTTYIRVAVTHVGPYYLRMPYWFIQALVHLNWSVDRRHNLYGIIAEYLTNRPTTLHPSSDGRPMFKIGQSSNSEPQSMESCVTILTSLIFGDNNVLTEEEQGAIVDICIAVTLPSVRAYLTPAGEKNPEGVKGTRRIF